MAVYLNYSSLVSSSLLDKLIWNKLIGNISLLFLLSILSGSESIIPIWILYSKTLINQVIIKRFIGWIGVISCIYLNIWPWIFILISSELIREFLTYLLPFILKKLETRIQIDPCGETMFKRICRVLRLITQQSPFISLQALITYSAAFKNGDSSEGFTDEERQKFRRFFLEFSQTSFIIEDKSITILFPSFIIRFGQEGIQLTSDEAIKLIRKENLSCSSCKNKFSNLSNDNVIELIQNNHEHICSPCQGKFKDLSIDEANKLIKFINDEEICVICRDKFSNLAIELKCKHQYCHKCIFLWLNQQYSCPTCRSIVN